MRSIFAEWEPPSVWTVMGGIASLLSVLFALYRVHKGVLAWRDEQMLLRRRVEKMWTYLCRRGWVEAQQSGVVTPYQSDKESVRFDVREAFAPRAGELRAWYRREWRIHENDTHPFRDDEAKLEIEHRFGDWIAREVCLPLGIKSGECLQAALVIAREEHGPRRYDLTEPS